MAAAFLFSVFIPQELRFQKCIMVTSSTLLAPGDTVTVSRLPRLGKAW